MKISQNKIKDQKAGVISTKQYWLYPQFRKGDDAG